MYSEFGIKKEILELSKEVEKEIHRSYHEDNDEQALALLNAFVNIVKAKCAIIIPVDFSDDMPEDWVGLNEGDIFTLKDDVRLIPRTIETKPDENGKKKLYATRSESVKRSLKEIINTLKDMGDNDPFSVSVDKLKSKNGREFITLSLAE